MLRWNSQKKQETIFIKKCMYFSDHHLISISYSFPCLLKMYVFFLFFPKSLPKMSNFSVSILLLFFSMLSQIRSQKFQFWHEIFPPLWSKNLSFTLAWTTRNLGIWETASSGSQGETEYHQPPSIYPPPAYLPLFYLNFIMPPPTPFHSHLPINPWWKRQFYMFTLNYLPFLRAL